MAVGPMTSITSKWTALSSFLPPFHLLDDQQYLFHDRPEQALIDDQQYLFHDRPEQALISA